MKLTVTQNINKLNLQVTQNNTIVKLQPILNSSGFIETDPIFQASEASLFVAGDKANLDNQSGINSGDETTSSIQTKRPLKTINNESLEGTGNVQIDYNDLDNLPTIPIVLTNHSELTLDDGTNPHGTTKSDVGLSNVDNTSDVNKPISIAAQQAFDLKQDKLTETNLGEFMDGLDSKTDIKDVDEFIISDSEDSLKSKKTRFLDLKTKLKSYFDTFYLSLSIFNDFVTEVFVSLDNKLDKSTTPSSIYGTDVGGGQTMIPLSEFEKVINKVSSLNSPSNTTYPTTQAVVNENKKATITVELISQLTTNFYAPNALRINSTELISGSGTLSLKVNDIAYTLGNLISQGAKITAETTSASVYNLISVYE